MIFSVGLLPEKGLGMTDFVDMKLSDTELMEAYQEEFECRGFNEYAPLKRVAVRSPIDAWIDQAKVQADWKRQHFRAQPNLGAAVVEFEEFVAMLKARGADVIQLGRDQALSLDAIYTRDGQMVSPKGLLVCKMARLTRAAEPAINTNYLNGSTQGKDYRMAGVVGLTGTLEGSDIVWFDKTALAVGKGTRTNPEGIQQVKLLLGQDVDMHIVPLPAPDRCEGFANLWSLISPLDRNLALIYKPLLPGSFLRWLRGKGIRFVEMPKAEFSAVGANVLALGPRDILMLEGLPMTKARLIAAGCKVRTYRGREISLKGGGGPVSLTRPIIRG